MTAAGLARGHMQTAVQPRTIGPAAAQAARNNAFDYGFLKSAEAGEVNWERYPDERASHDGYYKQWVSTTLLWVWQLQMFSMHACMVAAEHGYGCNLLDIAKPASTVLLVMPSYSGS